jgi:hypothetical protein
MVANPVYYSLSTTSRSRPLQVVFPEHTPMFLRWVTAGYLAFGSDFPATAALALLDLGELLRHARQMDRLEA